MASVNYFENASGPYKPDPPRTSHKGLSNLTIDEGNLASQTMRQSQPTGYHGPGILGVHNPTPSMGEPFVLPGPISGCEDEANGDQWKLTNAIDEDLMTMTHDHSCHLRQVSQERRQSNQALKEVMFATNGLAFDDRMSRRRLATPCSTTHRSSPGNSNAFRTPRETTESQDFRSVCIKIRKMMAQGDHEAERQRLLATPICCESCGSPVTPVVIITPSRSFDVSGAWMKAAMSSSVPRGHQIVFVNMYSGILSKQT